MHWLVGFLLESSKALGLVVSHIFHRQCFIRTIITPVHRYYYYYYYYSPTFLLSYCSSPELSLVKIYPKLFTYAALEVFCVLTNQKISLIIYKPELRTTFGIEKCTRDRFLENVIEYYIA